MFRRKDSESPQASTLSKGMSSEGSGSEVKSQPELPRRQAEMPTNASAVTAAHERQRAATPPAASALAPTDQSDAKRLIVGNGISLSGEITACDRLIVEGRVQVTLNDTRAIEITESGEFTNGKAEVEDAEISGIYEGELTVRKRLLIRGTGRVRGTVRYGELQIERGGMLTGEVSMLDGEPSAKSTSSKSSSSGGSPSMGGSSSAGLSNKDSSAAAAAPSRA